ILDHKSEEAKKHTSMYGSSDDLIPQILSSIQRLCKLKQQYPKNVLIKTYRASPGKSLTVIDDSVIKVEKHVVGSSPNSRPNEIVFKNDSKESFKDYFRQYNDLDRVSIDYEC
ncbi:MAG: hypothetical protein WCA39_07960, partial [Nitrososphaeraceae archaeon]